ncbi:radical SAM protein [Labilibacter sediminis]|nr:radical SAM protein [Labilibacter sediminis]
MLEEKTDERKSFYHQILIRYSTYWKIAKQFSVLWTYAKAIVFSVSFRRIGNLIILLISYFLSIMFRKPLLWGSPWSLSIEPINVCNLKCPECPTGMGILKRPKGMLTVEHFEQCLNSLPRSLWHVNLYFQGEPIMHPDFFTLVQKTKQRKLLTSTSTNAHYLSYEQALKVVKSGLDTLIVSFDGVTQKVYEQYRVGGDIQKVFEGVKNLVKAKRELGQSTPVVVAQFLVFHHNEHQIEDFKNIAFDLGVDKLELKTAQVYDVKNKYHILPEQSKFSRYSLQKDGTVELKGSIKNKCWKHWSSAVITWDGEVVPCCFDKDGEHALGNVFQTTFNEIWQHSNYYKFRKQVLQNKEKINICLNCPIGRA